MTQDKTKTPTRMALDKLMTTARGSGWIQDDLYAFLKECPELMKETAYSSSPTAPYSWCAGCVAKILASDALPGDIVIVGTVEGAPDVEDFEEFVTIRTTRNFFPFRSWVYERALWTEWVNRAARDPEEYANFHKCTAAEGCRKEMFFDV